MFKKLLVLIVSLVCVGTLFGAATGITYNTTTNVEVGPKGTDYVLFYGQTTATVATDSIGDQYTKAMYIADFQVETTNAFFFVDGYDVTTAGSGTEDCNVYVEYSFDRTTWVVGAAASGKIQDQVVTTAFTDTLNVIAGATDTNFNIYPWMRLHFDYQAGNPIGAYLWWKIRLKKPIDLDYPRKSSLTANKI